MRDVLGVCQWFHYEDYETLERTVYLLKELGVKHLRTGISWADYFRPGGKAWYDWQMRALADFDVLLSVWHTPPSIAEGGVCAGPPKRLRDYADFIDMVISRYGDEFGALELWNEPNNRYKWNFERFDPMWEKFGAMIVDAAHWAQRCGKQTVLGGMMPVDPHWLRLMKQYGVLEHIDVVAIHGFPYMWWPDAPNWDWYSHWNGWNDRISQIASESDGRPVWVTETGLATWDLERREPARFELQVDALREAAAAQCDRIYWYTLIDLDPQKEAIEGFHVDENEYNLGLVTFDGTMKPAFDTFRQLLRGKNPARPQIATVPSG